MVISAKVIFSFGSSSPMKSIESVGLKEPSASILHLRGGSVSSKVTGGRF